MLNSILMATAGGALIGLAASLLLWGTGKIAGSGGKVQDIAPRVRQEGKEEIGRAWFYLLKYFWHLYMSSGRFR